MHPRNSDLRGQGLVRLGVRFHPCRQFSHAEMYDHRTDKVNAKCTVIGMEWRALIEHHRQMTSGTPGEKLRAWRKHAKLGIERAAELIAEEAHTQGVGKSRFVPGTHPSLSRWETDKIQPKIMGLEVMAKVYGAKSYLDLFQFPPDTDAAVGAPDVEDEVAAYRRFLQAQKANKA